VEERNTGRVDLAVKLRVCGQGDNRKGRHERVAGDRQGSIRET
jgi:hypothetical protein